MNKSPAIEAGLEIVRNAVRLLLDEEVLVGYRRIEDPPGCRIDVFELYCNVGAREERFVQALLNLCKPMLQEMNLHPIYLCLDPAYHGAKVASLRAEREATKTWTREVLANPDTAIETIKGMLREGLKQRIGQLCRGSHD